MQPVHINREKIGRQTWEFDCYRFTYDELRRRFGSNAEVYAIRGHRFLEPIRPPPQSYVFNYRSLSEPESETYKVREWLVYDVIPVNQSYEYYLVDKTGRLVSESALKEVKIPEILKYA